MCREESAESDVSFKIIFNDDRNFQIIFFFNISERLQFFVKFSKV